MSFLRSLSLQSRLLAAIVLLTLASIAVIAWIGYTTTRDALTDSAMRELEAEAAEFDRRSGERMHAHHRWAQATTALQVAIAMAAIALITRRRWLHGLVFAFAGAGLALGALAIAHV